jgi:hypothetical protein
MMNAIRHTIYYSYRNKCVLCIVLKTHEANI